MFEHIVWADLTLRPMSLVYFRVIWLSLGEKKTGFTNYVFSPTELNKLMNNFSMM